MLSFFFFLEEEKTSLSLLRLKRLWACMLQHCRGKNIDVKTESLCKKVQKFTFTVNYQFHQLTINCKIVFKEEQKVIIKRSIVSYTLPVIKPSLWWTETYFIAAFTCIFYSDRTTKQNENISNKAEIESETTFKKIEQNYSLQYTVSSHNSHNIVPSA